MKKTLTALFAVLCLISQPFGSMAADSPAKKTDTVIGVQRRTSAVLSDFGRLEVFPSYADLTYSREFRFDFRCRDISSLDLSDKFEALMYSDFDSSTKWPETLPEGFSPEEIMELGKDPGLGVRKLHEQGIDGSGVGIAIIDQVLFTEHSEYADRLMHYEEMPYLGDDWAMHGNAVASIAVGKTVGVAPKAELYFIASELRDKDNDKTFIHYAEAIHRILDINSELPGDKKIRVISVSVGWSKDERGYTEIHEAVERAKKEGVFVVSTSLTSEYGFSFSGLGRQPLADPNGSDGYAIGNWQIPHLHTNEAAYGPGRLSTDLFFPMDSRTYASWTGENDYAWGRTGGWSWAVPYIAGLYALCAQVYPDITPDVFWQSAVDTSVPQTFEIKGKTYLMQHMANPLGLIEAVQD